MSRIRTALLSVYDKGGINDFARGLADRGVKVLSTGGTARRLRGAGIEVTPVEEITGQGEMLGGRVKTLHPALFAGILARREEPEQLRELETAGLETIDLVAVNLYPFEETVAEPGHALVDALEQIDIGGVSLLRAASKNFPGVVVAVDPGDYDGILEAIDAGAIPLSRRLGWARKSIAHTARYEAAICNYLASIDGTELGLDATPSRTPHPRSLALTFDLGQTLRYGENPHQEAAFYAARGLDAPGLGALEQLQGKELSFNNLLDLDAAWQLAWSLPSPGAAVIKHANPCGAATAGTIRDAYVRARATDPKSAFGGIVGLNGTVDEATAEEIVSTFIEVVVAPEFDPGALEVLAGKESLRAVRLPEPGAARRLPDLRFVTGGLLVQDRDGQASEQWRVVSQRQPTTREEEDLRFLWRVVPAVRSNAIVVGRGGQLLGVGAGQMSRVDACRFATWKARDAGHDLDGSAAASDAFFPFPDGLEALAAEGVRAIVQPGGSKRDPEVIAAADRLDVALVHTGARHFRH